MFRRSPLRHGFTLVELLLALVGVGVLAAVALTQISGVKQKAYVATMKSDLSNYAYAQGRRYTLGMPYAVEPESIPSEYKYSTNTMTVRSVADSSRWWLIVGHSGTSTVCRVGGGDLQPVDRLVVCGGNVMIPPSATYGFQPSQVTADSTITFDASGSQQPGYTGTYSWDFGDGGTGTGTTVTHQFAAAGSYPVSLSVTDPTGQQSRFSKLITVLASAPGYINQPPVAAFSLSTTSPIPGVAVTMDASGSSDPDGSISAYLWNYGDGTSGTGATASHSYATAGPYTVGLTVTDNQGATTSATHTLTANSPPVAGFTVTTPVPSGSSIAANNTSTDPDAGQALSYAWDFGDGTTSAQTTPAKAYATPGSYTITLTATDPFGTNSTVTHAINVSNRNPTASFVTGQTVLAVRFTTTGTFSCASGCTVNGDSVTVGATTLVFTGSSNFSGMPSFVGLGQFAAYGGNPNGGAYDDFSGVTFTLHFWETSPQNGTNALSGPMSGLIRQGYSNVQWTATVPSTAIGSVNYAPGTGYVGAPDGGALSLGGWLSSDTQKAGKAFTFTSTASDPDGGTITYAWNFGDGATSTAANPSHSYSAVGTYTVNLTVSDGQGGSAVATRTVTVTP